MIKVSYNEGNRYGWQIYSAANRKTRMKLSLNPRVSSFLWVLAAISLLVFSRPIFFLVAMAIFVVVTFRRAGPISGWNRGQLAIGFVGWFAINTLVRVLLLEGDWHGDPFGLFRGFIILTVNLLALLVLSLRRGQILVGAFLALPVNALGYLLFVDLEDFGRFIVIPFFLYFFYPNL